jgi:hypothetical protein
MVGRDLSEAEQKLTTPEQLLAMAVWGMRRLSGWLSFAAGGVSVVLPSKECLLLVKDKQVHARLRAYVLELQMYGVSFSLDEKGCPLLHDPRAFQE